MQNEEWRDCVGFPGFEVSASGRVRNLDTGVILSGTINSRGIRQYTMRACKEMITTYAPNLVWDAFVGDELLPNEHIFHIDGNRSNDHFTNLEPRKERGRPRKW